MILRKYKTIIKDEIDRVLNDNKYPKIEYQIKEIANPEFGQLYTNIPFILSRIIKIIFLSDIILPISLFTELKELH